MNLQKLIFTNNRCYKAGKTITPKGIMVHSTGANNPNLRRYVGPDDGLLGKNTYGNHWNKDNLSVCVHAFIGKLKDGSIATYQTLPWNHRGWHAGGSANNTHISFEICEDGLKDKAYFDKVYKEAVELCVFICKQYGLTEKDIICHSEGYKKGIASNHGDVMHWFPKHGKSMDTFRADVKAMLESDIAEQPEEPGPEDKPATSTKTDYAESFDKSKAGTYKVKSFDGLNLRTGATTAKAIIEAMPNGAKVRCYGYYTGAWLYVVSPSGATGFCHSSYLERL